MRRKKFTLLIWSLLFLRLALFGYYLAVDGNPYQPDSERYLQLAANLHQHGLFSTDGEGGDPEIFRTPGYPGYIAFWRLFGVTTPHAVAATQELLYLATVFLAFLGIRRLFSEKTARICTLFLLLEPGGLAYPKLMLSETLFLPLFLSGFITFGIFLSSGRNRWIAVSGLLLGLATLVRPAAMLLPPLFALIAWIACGRSVRAMQPAGLLLACFLLVLSPWLMRNQLHFGVLYVSGQTSNMLANYHVPLVWESSLGIPFEEGGARMQNEVQGAIEERERDVDRSLNAVERYRLQQDLALSELARLPWDYALHWLFGILKSVLGGGMTELHGTLNHHTDRLHFFQVQETGLITKALVFIRHQDPLVFVELIARVLIAGLALIGALRIIRGKDPLLWAMLVTNIYFLSIAGPMGYGRFRFPVEVLWFLQAGLGFTLLLDLLRTRLRGGGNK